VGAGAAAALLLASGGTASRHGTSAVAVVSEHVQSVEQRKADQAKYDGCQQQMRPLLDSLSELDSRLNVGLSYDEYTNQVGNVRVDYDAIDFGQLDDPACLASVGIPSEKALNQYAKAATVWNNCIGDFNCSNDSIKPTLQRYWSRATTLVASAKDGLDAMKPGA
jgi:hypothetical protein